MIIHFGCPGYFDTSLIRTLRLIDFRMAFDVCFFSQPGQTTPLPPGTVGGFLAESAGVGILGTAHRTVQVKWLRGTLWKSVLTRHVVEGVVSSLKRP